MDPHFILNSWILIRIENTQIWIRKKSEEIYCFLSAGCTPLRAAGFSCSLIFLPGGLRRDNYIAIKKKIYT
jgi:hypothetical protein